MEPHYSFKQTNVFVMGVANDPAECNSAPPGPPVRPATKHSQLGVTFALVLLRHHLAIV
jgi:hypothetical protein